MSIVSDAVWDALRASIRAPEGSAREQVGELVQRVGGIGELARITSGTPEGRLPAQGTEQRRAYLAARRSIERYLRGERTPAAGRLERLARAALARADDAWRRGIRITITGVVRVSKDRRRRTLVIVIPEPDAGELVDMFEAGDRGAFDEFIGDEELGDFYGVDFDLEEIESVDVEPARGAAFE